MVAVEKNFIIILFLLGKMLFESGASDRVDKEKKVRGSRASYAKGSMKEGMKQVM